MSHPISRPGITTGQRITTPGITTGKGMGHPPPRPGFGGGMGQRPRPTPPIVCHVCKGSGGKFVPYEEPDVIVWHWQACERCMSDAKLPEPRIDNESYADYSKRIAREKLAEMCMGSIEPPKPPRLYDRPAEGRIPSPFLKAAYREEPTPRREGSVYEPEPESRPLKGRDGIPNVFSGLVDYPKGYKRPADWPAPDQQAEQFAKGAQKRRWWQRKPKPDTNVAE